MLTNRLSDRGRWRFHTAIKACAAVIAVKTIQNKRSSETTFSIGFYHVFMFIACIFVNWRLHHSLTKSLIIFHFQRYFWPGTIFASNKKTILFKFYFSHFQSAVWRSLFSFAHESVCAFLWIFFTYKFERNGHLWLKLWVIFWHNVEVSHPELVLEGEGK